MKKVFAVLFVFAACAASWALAVDSAAAEAATSTVPQTTATAVTPAIPAIPVAPVEATPVEATMAATAPESTASSLGEGAATPEEAVKQLREQVSYGIGYSTANNFRRQFVDIDQKAFARGVADAYSEAQPQVSQTQMRQALTAFNAILMDKLKKVGEENEKAGAEFLANNSKKEGIVTLPSGLQYKVEKEGAGPAPKAEDIVKVKYKGVLLDGTEFDNSERHGGSVEFPVGQVIPGWSEALQLMKVGSKWKVFVPGSLGYGEQGNGPHIYPNATLIFNVELLEIVKEGAAAEAGSTAPDMSESTTEETTEAASTASAVE